MATRVVYVETNSGALDGYSRSSYSWGVALAVALLSTALSFFSGSALAAAQSAPCNTERLRSYLNSSLLPDCRAYEMVTPSYKEGYPAFLTGTQSDYSSNGEKVIISSDANLVGSAGQGQTPEGAALYMDTRTLTGWQLTPLNAPMSQFVGQIPVAIEANNGGTLWVQHKPQQGALTRDLYIRSADGTFRLVGPSSITEPNEEPSNAIEATVKKRGSEIIAATANYGHIVLNAHEPADYWPFDSTQNSGSLYEYSGIENSQPILVGVTGSKGSEHLVSSCGTYLGGSSYYNALSDDGESIFFTVNPGCGGAEFTEVYARLHGSLVSPDAASTVDVTASECTLGIVACGEASGKSFEGASENGKQIFFTSTEKLTNSAVSGSLSGDSTGNGCAATALGAGGCNLYEYNFSAGAGERLRLISGGEVLGVAGIAEGGSRIYYVSREVIVDSGADDLGDSPTAEQPNLYVYDAISGTTRFIRTLNEENDSTIWAKEFAARPVEVAGNEGQFLLLASSTPGLTADETVSTEPEQLFEYNAETGELVRVTKGEDGYNKDGNGVAVGFSPGSISEVAGLLGSEHDFKSTTNQLNVSQDGRTVVFAMRGRLSARAVSAELGCKSVYEFRTPGLLSEGSVHLLSDGSDTQLNKGSSCGAGFVGVDAEAGNVLFSTADELVPGDTDGFQRDIYDARENGGFAPAVGGCGLVCEGGGMGGGGPVLPAPGSSFESGEADLLPPVVKKKKAKKVVSRASRLARALKACKRVAKRLVVACERKARRLYGLKGKAKKSLGSSSIEGRR